jgi:hypothetical protein
VIVNGDDMLFKCKKSFYPVFLTTSAEAGFKISTGKNYLSPTHALINSQIFRRRCGRMERFGYLNLRLVKGESLKGGVSAATPTMIGRELSVMADLCPWTASCLSTAFRRFRKDDLSWYRPNWFLPVHLGGFGVHARHSEKFRVTRAQRLLAAMFIHSPQLALYRRQLSKQEQGRHGFMAMPLKAIQGALANWRMKESGSKLEEGDQTENKDPWLARLAYAYRVASSGTPDGGCNYISRDYEIIRVLIQRDYRLKPASLERIGDFYSAYFVSFSTPVCPPLSHLRVVSERPNFVGLAELMEDPVLETPNSIAQANQTFQRESQEPSIDGVPVKEYLDIQW